MTKLTENLIQQRLKTCTTDLDKVQQINVTGRELQDVSLLREMTGVEVLSLSVNQISSLADFQYCKNLRELYLRHNKIRNINEIFYLKGLPKLELLMLSQNPCAEEPLYRMTVIKNLQNLKELDRVPITQEERRMAQKEGVEVIISDTPIECGENCLPDGNQIPKNSTHSAQRMTAIGESVTPDPPKTKTFKIIKKKSSVGANVKDSGKEPVQNLPVSEKSSFQGKQNTKVKVKPVSSLTHENNKALNAALCKLCGNTSPECIRINPQNSNILSATLSLIKELDYASLQIVNAEVSSLLSAFEVNFICQRQPVASRTGECGM